MNISSVIVISHPERVADVQRQLQALPGVEIHGVSAEGKLIVVIETEDDRTTIETYERLGQLDGVLSVAMVYHQSEPEPESEISVVA